MLHLILTLALANPVTGETPEVVLPSVDGPDPHLWLEEVHGEAAMEQVQAWNRATLDRYEADARFAEMQEEALEILTSDARLATGSIRGKYFYNHWQSPDHVRGLWRRSPLKAYLAGEPDWTVLLDLDALAEKEDENWIWHGATCAPASDRCLVDLSRGGKDASVVREFSLDTLAFVEDGFVLPEAKSEVTFLDEDTVLLATDFGEGSLTESGYPRQVARWTRGQAHGEATILRSGEVGDVSMGGFTVHHHKDSETLLVQAKTFYEQAFWWLDGDEQIALPLPARAWIHGLFRGSLIVGIQEDWSHGGRTFTQGSLVAFDLETQSASLVMAAEDGVSIEGVQVGKKGVFVQVLADVVGKLVRLRPDGEGWSSTTIGLPDNGQVRIVAGSDSRDDLLVTFESLTRPVTLFHIDKKDGVHELDALPSFFEAEGIVVEQRFATSSDGTKIPYFLMAREDVLANGPAPTIQYGYGGFQAAILPTYYRDAARPQQGAFAGRLWVEDGGVLVLSNIRGGSEYGPAWHQAALKAHRQLAYDDFFAIGEALVADGVTTAEQLGAVGRSNGGLLMGVVLTQRPDLYHAVDIGVPLLDMLRFDKLLAGASWTGEYGDPDVPEERKTLASYSPYQNLDPEADYPHVLFYTSTRDDRVHPGHARKMAAALESLGVPFDYWENIEGGHGGVANQEQAALRIALELLYFKRELGL